MSKYTLFIRRYNRYETFESFEEFRRTVKQYFTSLESGIVEKLTTFPPESFTGDHWERSWNDFTTCAYPA